MQEGNPLKSWLPTNNGFPLQNIPFSTYKSASGDIHCATRVGDFVVDLAVLEKAGLFNDKWNAHQKERAVFSEPHLNKFMELGKEWWHEARVSIQEIFQESNEVLRDNEELRKAALIKAEDAQMTLPVKIGDYTDFYSSRPHAFNIGSIVRGPDNAMQDNWFHLPVGYHGRASTVLLGDGVVRRPKGQVRPKGAKDPKWSECKRLDFELEVGAFVGKSNPLGQPIKVKEAGDYIFGLTLLNDWSARDIQVWEYVPLGPFNAKNFLTTISPWIVTTEALAPFKKQLPAQDPKPFPYLDEGDSHSSYDINLFVDLELAEQPGKTHTVTKTNFSNLYWSVEQQLTHHAVTGCNMNVGDLLGSGTISGEE